MRVLVVEDNLDIQANIADYLEDDISLDFAFNGDQGLELATSNDYDVIVLDLMLPGRHGLEVCAAYREAATVQAPIIMITAHDTIDDKAAGFAAGADDYLVKPFALRELRMRIEALARRPKLVQRTKLAFGDLELERGSDRLSCGAQSVALHEKAARLLATLMEAAPDPASNDRLIYALWGEDPPDSGALRTHVYYLRRILAELGSTTRVCTLRGKGYALAAEDCQ